MSSFAEELKSARAALGHRTARAFFDELKERGVTFNYSYYMRLEQGGIPSERVTQELAAALKGVWGERLVLAHCRAIFPKFTHLFPGSHGGGPPLAPGSPVGYQPSGQKELTLKQVSAIAASEVHYHLFLLATLARSPIAEKDLAPWLPPRALVAAVKDLKAAGLIRLSPAGFEPVAVESRFPEAYNKELKTAYAQFDRWDESFGGQFALDFLVNKMLIRRVSARYVAIIRKQLDVLFELVKGSDETEVRHNDNVLQLKVVLRQGKLPG